MSSGSTASAVRRSLKSFEEALALFTTSLASETAELRRNIDNQPTTGSTFYARILEDLTDRLEGVEQELQALEGVSLDAISLEVSGCSTCRHLLPPATPQQRSMQGAMRAAMGRPKT